MHIKNKKIFATTIEIIPTIEKIISIVVVISIVAEIISSIVVVISIVVATQHYYVWRESVALRMAEGSN